MSKDNDTIHLKDLSQGDLIRAVAGVERDDRYVYDLLVQTPGEKPTVLLSQKNPDGTVVGPTTAFLVGVGRRLTRAQNPVQSGDDMVTISFGQIFPGGNLIVIDPNEKVSGRRIELMPKCTSIQVFPNAPKTATDTTE